MKTFKFFKMLAVLIVLITSIPQMRGALTINGGTLYFDDSGYKWNDVYMCVGSDSYTTVYGMTNISNTKLYYKDMSYYSGANYIRFIACNWGSGSWGPTNYNCGYGYTNIYGANWTFNSNSLYLFTAASSNNGADVYLSNVSKYQDLNGKVITVKAKVSEDNGRTYSETTSPATLSASSHEYNGYNTCNTSRSLSNGTISCGYAATTNLTAPSTDPTGYAFVGWYDASGNQWTTSKTLTIYPTANATFYAYYRKLYSIAASSTVVFDLGLNDMNYGNASWSAVYLYRDRNGTTAQNDQFTQIGSTTQYHKTYASAQSNLSCILFRGNTSNWNGYTHTTNICRNVSGVTLFTYCNSMTYDDNKYKLDWQVTTDAKKATSGKKIYFDNTNVSTWTSIYLKYGTNWASGGFTRVTSAATKVNGTSNLYYITIPNDLYYKEYFLSKETGSTGYVNIETMTSITNRTAYQTSNIDADATLIATTGTGTGTAGNPKVWSVEKMTGHTHNVAITTPSHGTITVGYTDENSASQSFTSGDVNVARTCTLTVSSSPSTGYNRGTLTINDDDHTSGSSYTIRQDITVEATFTPMSCSITFDKNGGEGGADGTTATYDADMTRVTVPHIIGYRFDGYYDGETDGNGSGTKYYNADGTSAKPWDVATESSQTLYAKWVSDTKTFNGGGSDKSWTTAGNWSGSAVPSDDWSSVTINAEVELSSAVHIGQLSFGENGKLVIQPTGALEVAGTITNTEASKIEINSSGSNQGALIFNSTGSTAATVTMTMNASDGKFNFIAIPVSYVDVSEAFAGSGVFTYVWDNSENKWDKRGYYDGISAYEAIIAKGIGSTTFSGNLLSNNTNFSSGSLSYSSDGDGNVYMFGNSWTAPIKHSAMTLNGIASMNILNGTSNGWDGVTGDDVIPALQAYVVEVGSSGGSITINYENAVRSVAKGSRNTALKAPQRYADEKPEPITIYVSGNDMRTRIRLFEDATRFSDELDEGWEAYYMEGEGYAGDFYAIGTRKMNVLATSDLEGTVVGFVPGQATSYTISFAGDGKGYYLNDTELEMSTLIAEGNTYEFTPNESTNATRFVISKTPIRNTPTGLEEVSEGTKARKQLIDGVLYIIRDGRIYNTTGALYK